MCLLAHAATASTCGGCLRQCPSLQSVRARSPRDGRHFHVVLNYLRNGSLNYPADGTDWQYLLELRAEAEFYGLLGLMAIIDRYCLSEAVLLEY
jgi:hypothetical protein